MARAWLLLAAAAATAVLRGPRCFSLQGRLLVPRHAAVHQEPSPGHNLDSALLGLEAAVRPLAEEQRRHRQLLATLEAAAKEVHADAQIWPFGACVDGSGEGGGDMQAVLYLPPEAPGDADRAWFRQQSLRRLSAACRRRGLEEGSASPGVLRLEDRVSIQEEDYFRSCVLAACEVQCQQLLPLLSTRLVRGYVELDSRVRLLAVAVRRWTKAKLLTSKEHEGFPAPYAWMLLVIFYLQVHVGLPSLHAIGRQGRPLPDLPPGHSDVSFMASASPPRRRRVSTAPGQLLRGFFAFYGREFDWHGEVASVRLGERSSLSSTHFEGLRLLQERLAVGLNVENPVQVSRNLNEALDVKRCSAVRAALQQAEAELAAGAGLAELLKAEEELPCAEQLEPFTLRNFLPLAEVAGEPPVPQTCLVCQEEFPCSLLLMQHQADTGHCNSVSDAKLSRLRDDHSRAQTDAEDRLRAALGDIL